MKRRFTAITLFSSAGIGEYYLEDLGIKVLRANELIERRAKLYNQIYGGEICIIGDIVDPQTKEKLIDGINNIDIVIATPPCQGLSIAGKYRNNNTRIHDPRNYLIFHAIEVIKKLNPKYILFENVKYFEKMILPYNGGLHSVLEILSKEFINYNIESKILECADFGIPQYRQRNVIKLYRKNLSWPWPEKKCTVTLEEAISHLPSIESGMQTNIPWHFGRTHSKIQVEAIKRTPTGMSAFDNEVFFPKNRKGERVKGYNTTYKRMAWDRPAPTITMRNDAISSQANCHPGRKLPDGMYSDARVLSLRELYILTSLPEEPKIPLDSKEILIRQVIGECVPPLLLKEIFSTL